MRQFFTNSNTTVVEAHGLLDSASCLEAFRLCRLAVCEVFAEADVVLAGLSMTLWPGRHVQQQGKTGAMAHLTVVSPGEV